MSVGQITEYIQAWNSEGEVESGKGYAKGIDGKVKEIDADFFNLVSGVERIPIKKHE